MNKTLKLKLPPGKTLVLSLIVIFLLMITVEIFFHFQFIQDMLPYPSIGSGHHRLDFKLALLDDLLKKEGRVDCLFLGGSDVNAAMNPDIFSQIYKNKLGEKIICFNFGIAGALPATSSILAEILVKKYHPQLLIYGFNPFSLSDKFRKQTKKLILKNPWCSYQLGNFNLEGWMAAHSLTYRYFLRFRTWLEQPTYSERLSKQKKQTSPYGFNKSNSSSPFKQDPEQKARYHRILSDFSLSQDELAGFEKMLRLSSKTRIVFAEIPVYPKFQFLMQKNPDTINKINRKIMERISDSKNLYIPASQLLTIPPEGFLNIGHMNNLGARIFSRSLAEKVVNAIQEGFIAPLEHQSAITRHTKESAH